MRGRVKSPRMTVEKRGTTRVKTFKWQRSIHTTHSGDEEGTI